MGTQELTAPMLADLRSRLEEYGWVGQGRLGGEDGEWSAIAYRTADWKPVDSGTFWLSETPEVPGSISWDSSLPRICTWCLLESVRQPGVRILAFNTHLDHMGREARSRGLRIICERLAEMRRRLSLPVILTGDFNDEPDSEPLRVIGEFPLGAGAAAGERLVNAYDAVGLDAEQTGGTFHDFKGGEEGLPIDYIFVSPEITVDELQVDRSQVDGGYPSDHYPVAATVRIG
jgi:endonuclease/exonuclease/phosphatase family metal-dependent hydrolase